MKKIKILNWSLIIFIALGVISIIANFGMMIYDNHFIDMIYSKSGFGMTSFYIINALTLMLLFGLYQVQQSFSSFIKNSFFNSRSAKLIKKGGLLLVANGILSGLHSMFFFNKTPESIIANYMMYAMIILIGIGLMAVSEIISKGERIEQENLLII